jgi:hypothetical protein
MLFLPPVISSTDVALIATSFSNVSKSVKRSRNGGKKIQFIFQLHYAK